MHLWKIIRNKLWISILTFIGRVNNLFKFRTFCRRNRENLLDIFFSKSRPMFKSRYTFISYYLFSFIEKSFFLLRR